MPTALDGAARLHPRFPRRDRPRRRRSRRDPGARRRDRAAIADVLAARPRTTSQPAGAVRRARHRAGVVWLRAWFRYLRQTGSASAWSPWSTRCAARRQATKALIGLFTRRTIPPPARRATAAIEAARAIRRRARQGRGDRRRPHPAADARVVEATLRTNAFAPARRRGARVQDRFASWSRACRAGAVARDLGLFARASRASTCAAARSPAAACAGPTGATISAPRSSA
jgi:hypothetical protein